MDTTTDVIIIGGGITGTSAAYHLALRGHKVTLLEKTQLGAGSTGRTGGIIRQHYSLEVTARIAHRAVQVWKDFDNVVGGDVGWMETGGIFMSPKEGVDTLKASIAMQQKVGIKTEFVDVDALREIAPYLNLDDIGGAAYEPGSGVADGAMSVNAYAKRARDLGAIIKQGVEVTAITAQSGKVTGVETTEGTISAPVVINAAGPWAAHLAKGVGFDVPAEASRHEIAVFQLPKGSNIPEPFPIMLDMVQGVYMRPETGNLMLAGTTKEDEADNKVDPDNYATNVSMEFNAERADETERRIPVMSEAGVGRGWAGLYTVTPDWNPIIGPMHGLEGFISAFGFSGSGFKLGPVIGEILADLATGDKQCPIDPHPFRFERFAEDDLIKGNYEYGIVG